MFVPSHNFVSFVVNEWKSPPRWRPRIAPRYHLPYPDVSPKPNQAVSPLLQTEPATARLRGGFSRAAPLWQLAFLAAISLWLYGLTLARLAAQWWHDPNFSHGFFVPLFSAYVVWQQRHRLARLEPRPAWLGLPLLALALAMLIIGQLGAELFTARASFLLLLAGIVILCLGWNYFRALLFPWAFLLLMIPIPAILFDQITFPLQLLASRVAAAVLSISWFGAPLVPVLREGNVMHLPAMNLAVAEACSGIRSLLSLIALSVIYGYLLEKRIWVRAVLALASVPIAIAANSVRIIGTGLLVQYWDAEKAEGYFHASWGVIIFVVSLLMLYALHGLISLVWRQKGGRA